jgi:hypothetical protein
MAASQTHERVVSAKNAVAAKVIKNIAVTHKVFRDTRLAIEPPNTKPCS